MKKFRILFYGFSISACLYFGTNVLAADCEPVYRSVLEISPDHAGLQKALALILEAKKAGELDHFGEVQPSHDSGHMVLAHSTLTRSEYPVLFELLMDIKNQKLPKPKSVFWLQASRVAKVIFEDNQKGAYVSDSAPLTYDQIKARYMGEKSKFIEIVLEF